VKIKKNWVPAILVIALALRLVGSGTWSFWNDEIATVQEAKQLFHYSGAKRYPINYILTTTTFHFLGESEFTARLLPVLWGTAQIALVFFLGQEIFDRKVGLLSALLLAFQPYHIFWSQNARHYALLSLCLLGFLLTLQKWRSGQPAYLRTLVLFLVSLGTHTTALLIVPALVVACWRRIPLRWWMVVSGGWLVFFCLCLTWEPLHTVTVGRFTSGRLWGGDAVHLLGAFVYYFNPAIIILAFLGWWYQRARTEVNFLMYWVLLPLTILFGLSFFGDVSIAYGFFTLPVVVVLAASFLVKARVSWWLIAALLVGALLPPLFWYYDSNGQRPRYREAAQIIDANHGYGSGKYLYTSMPRTFSYYVKTPVVGISSALLADEDVLLLVDPDFRYLNPGLSFSEERVRLQRVLPARTPVRDYSLKIYYLSEAD